MILDLPDTSISLVSKSLVKLRDEGGAVALGRVLTLIIVTRQGYEEEAIEAANDASREHPMRVIVVSAADDAAAQEPRLDAEIRIGGDAGASEVIVLRPFGEATGDDESLVTGLLLPDAPVVAWWPADAPAVVAESAIGRIAQLRITDASNQPDPQLALTELANSYRPGDVDFAWTRLTLWRAQLAAVLDQPPYTAVTAIEVTGGADSPSTTLLAAWLHLQLQAPVRCDLVSDSGSGSGIHYVTLVRDTGAIELARPEQSLATLTQPDQPAQHLSLPRRTLRDCLAEELRRLDPDALFGQVITRGLDLLVHSESTHMIVEADWANPDEGTNV